jgi:hypothetical protein
MFDKATAELLLSTMSDNLLLDWLKNHMDLILDSLESGMTLQEWNEINTFILNTLQARGALPNS